MLSQLTTQKIQPEHLDRSALIYIRQSTLIQVRENTGSTARQYDLLQRALNLGWSREQVVVVDAVRVVVADLDDPARLGEPGIQSAPGAEFVHRHPRPTQSQPREFTYDTLLEPM